MKNIFLIITLMFSLASNSSFSREMPISETELVSLFLKEIHNLEWAEGNEQMPETVAESFASALLVLVNGQVTYYSEVGGGKRQDGDQPEGAELTASCVQNKSCTIGVANGSVIGYSFTIKREWTGFYSIDSKVTPVSAN